MIKSLLAAGTILVALAGPAFAHQCPSLAAKAEEALKTTTVDDATKAKVTELIATGMSQHEAGKHDGIRSHPRRGAEASRHLVERTVTNCGPDINPGRFCSPRCSEQPSAS